MTQCHVYIMFSDEAKVTDVFLKLDVDFDRNVLDGSVTLTVEKVKPEATHVVSYYLIFINKHGRNGVTLGTLLT